MAQENLIKSWSFTKLRVLHLKLIQWKKGLERLWQWVFSLRFLRLDTVGLPMKNQRVSKEIQAGPSVSVNQIAHRYKVALLLIGIAIAFQYIKFLFKQEVWDFTWYHVNWYYYFNITGHLFGSVFILIAILIAYFRFAPVILTLVAYNSYIILYFYCLASILADFNPLIIIIRILLSFRFFLIWYFARAIDIIFCSTSFTIKLNYSYK